MFQGVVKIRFLHAGCVLADQLLKRFLPRDETDDRYRAISLLGLHQFGQLLTLLVNKSHVGSVTGQPENKFIEEKNDPVVPFDCCVDPSLFGNLAKVRVLPSGGHCAPFAVYPNLGSEVNSPSRTLLHILF